MVDKNKLLEQLRKLKKQINNDPQVRALYDLDGDGSISGEEWEKARQSVIAFMKTQDSMEKTKEPSAALGAAGMGLAGAAGAADAVFNQIKNTGQTSFGDSDGNLFSVPEVIVTQQVEGLELMTDFEGRNSYKLSSPSGRELGHAEESDTGMLGLVTRNMFTARRPFTMGISVFNTPETVWLKRKFEFIFSSIEVSDDDEPVGTIQQRFSLINRKYDLQPYTGMTRTLTIKGPIFKPWTFYVMSGINQVGCIKKNWSGVFKEAFTRADTFTITFEDSELTIAERKLIIGAAIAIDIDYFEQKQKKSRSGFHS